MPLTDSVITLSIFAAVYFGLRGLKVPGAGGWAIASTLALATWRLQTGGQNWGSLGLLPPTSWRSVLLWIISLYATIVIANIAIVTPIARWRRWPPVDLSRFRTLPGNARALVLWLLLAWTTAAIAEELVFRGFLMTRFEIALGGGLMALSCAAFLQALIFGIAHAYLGARGALTAAVVALIFGAVYYLNGRQLVPLILGHGLIDSVSLIAIYAGASTRGA